METRNFLFTKPLRRCERHSRSFSLRRLLSLLASLFTPAIIHAHRVILDGRDALKELLNNRRHFIGGVLLVVGVFSILFHQLFLNEAARDWNWYYVNWYYYYFTIRPYVLLILWSSAFILFTPTKFSLAFIPFSIVQAAGWCMILHYSIFVNSNQSFHEIPNAYCIVIGLSLGFSIIMSLDYLLYRHHHITRNILSSFVGLAEMNAPAESKEEMYKQLAVNYRNKNARI